MKIGVCDDSREDRGALRALLEACGHDFEIREYGSGEELYADMGYVRAGIDTNSKQYKAVIQQMSKDGCNGSMFTSVQSIKNLMKNYNSRGEWVEPTTGLTGLLVTDETGDSSKKIIDIPENSKDKMFEAVKNIYLNNNGMTDGTGKTEIYMDMYRQMKSDDRLSAGYTLRQYHLADTQAFVSAIKE